jgi:hypothetical protein
MAIVPAFGYRPKLCSHDQPCPEERRGTSAGWPSLARPYHRMFEARDGRVCGKGVEIPPPDRAFPPCDWMNIGVRRAGLFGLDRLPYADRWATIMSESATKFWLIMPRSTGCSGSCLRLHERLLGKGRGRRGRAPLFGLDRPP